MSTYSDMARERRHARSLYLELRALGLDVRVEEVPEEPLCYRVVVGACGPSPRLTPTVS